MGYQALLFCPDETTARLVTQVLTELEFSVEPANEPFAAVKRLTTQHFDAVVVDCENEQNASLLFKSARNSGPNKTSLAVAVVEGQPGIAKAFRIGANLVLTKPINVEQSKGTLRVARGLLKKPEPAKPAAPAMPAATPARPTPTNPAFARPLTPSAPQSLKPVVPPKSITSRPAPPVQAEAPSLLELENEPTPQAESADVALLESMPDAPMPKAITPKPAWPPATSRPSSSMSSSAVGAAGVAPAREVAPRHVEPKVEPKHVEVPAFAEPAAPAARVHRAEPHSPAPALTTPAASGSGALKWVLIAAAILIAAAGGFFLSTKLHSAPSTPVSNAPAQTVPATSQPAATSAPVHDAAQSGSPSSASTQSAAVAPQPKATPSVENRPAEDSSDETPDVVKKNIAPAKPQSEHEEKPAREALVVKSPNARPGSSQADAPQAIPVIGITSNSGNKEIAGLMESRPTVPVLRTMKVSQGVSQGLLLKKVAPDYPAQARQLRIEGIVQLEATVAKDGSVKDVKVTGGHPILARAAVEAVKQWKYRPYLLNNSPVEIETQISVNFKLP